MRMLEASPIAHNTVCVVDRIKMIKKAGFDTLFLNCKHIDENTALIFERGIF